MEGDGEMSSSTGGYAATGAEPAVAVGEPPPGEEEAAGPEQGGAKGEDEAGLHDPQADNAAPKGHASQAFAIPSALAATGVAQKGSDRGATAESGKLTTAQETGYSYSQFVERFKHPSAQSVVNEVRDFVNQFPANLTRPQAARRIHSFLAEVTPRLLAAEVFCASEACTVDAAQELASEGLEKFVVLKLYKLLFRHAPADLRQDEHVEALIRSARAAKGPHAALLAAVNQLDSKHQETFQDAVLELQRVDQYRAPRDKSSCFLNAFRLIEGIVVERVFQKGTNEDSHNGDFQRTLLAALLVTATPPNLFSNIEFTAAFRNPSRINDDERKCLSELANSINLVAGSGAPRLAAAEMAEVSREAQVAAAPGSKAAGEAAPSEDMPLWLADAGVTFHFEERSADDLLIGEVDELLDEYQKMARALRELVDAPGSQVGTFKV